MLGKDFQKKIHKKLTLLYVV